MIHDSCSSHNCFSFLCVCNYCHPICFLHDYRQGTDYDDSDTRLAQPHQLVARRSICSFFFPARQRLLSTHNNTHLIQTRYSQQQPYPQLKANRELFLDKEIFFPINIPIHIRS
jgi:hypothetical protein